MFARVESHPEHRYTYDYRQPESYHFCLDSVLAPLLIASDLRDVDIGESYRVLDLGAGCGVMGFELAATKSEITAIDFLEIQDEFLAYFEANRDEAGRSAEDFRFIHGNWDTHVESAAYDLVISNPPYFFAEEGSLGRDELSNRCRFFLDSTFDSYARAVIRALKPGGRAYLLLKSGREHGRNALARLQVTAWDHDVDHIADVRGTGLVRVTARS